MSETRANGRRSARQSPFTTTPTSTESCSTRYAAPSISSSPRDVPTAPRNRDGAGVSGTAGACRTGCRECSMPSRKGEPVYITEGARKTSTPWSAQARPLPPHRAARANGATTTTRGSRVPTSSSSPTATSTAASTPPTSCSHLHGIAKRAIIAEPAEGKDASDHLATRTLSLAELAAQQYPASRALSVIDLEPAVEDVPVPVLICGDRLYRGAVHTLTGPPDCGKTTLACWWMLQGAARGRPRAVP